MSTLTFEELLARFKNPERYEGATSVSDVLPVLERVKAEIEAELETLGPFKIEVCEGGGPMNLFASLAVSVAKVMREMKRYPQLQRIEAAVKDRPWWRSTADGPTLCSLKCRDCGMIREPDEVRQTTNGDLHHLWCELEDVDKAFVLRPDESL